MDDPALDSAAHARALQGLARINRWTRSDRFLWPEIARLARLQPHRPLRVLDIATGSADVPIRLLKRAHTSGLRLEMHACDCSAFALDRARERARTAGVTVRLLHLDILRDPLPGGFDVLTSSLFLHHLTNTKAGQFLARCRDSDAQSLILHDLVRSRPAVAFTWIGTRLLTRSPVVHIDGVRSVRAAYTPHEVRELAERAGLSGAVVRRRHPFRLLLTWRRP